MLNVSLLFVMSLGNLSPRSTASTTTLIKTADPLYMVAYTRTMMTIIIGCIQVERSIYMYGSRCFFRRGYICPGEPDGSRDYEWHHLNCSFYSDPFLWGK